MDPRAARGCKGLCPGPHAARPGLSPEDKERSCFETDCSETKLNRNNDANDKFVGEAYHNRKEKIIHDSILNSHRYCNFRNKHTSKRAGERAGESYVFVRLYVYECESLRGCKSECVSV